MADARDWALAVSIILFMAAGRVLPPPVCYFIDFWVGFLVSLILFSKREGEKDE